MEYYTEIISRNMQQKIFLVAILSMVSALILVVVFIITNLGPSPPPFEFVPDPVEMGLTDDGLPIYATHKKVYEMGEIVTYSAWAMVHDDPYTLNPVFTLATADNDGRFDVCQFLGDGDFKRNITRSFDEVVELRSQRDTSECIPRPMPGNYYVEVVNCTEGTLCSAYLAGPFELR